MSGSDLGSLSLTEIFRMEAEEKCAQLDELLLQLEKRPGDRQVIDQLMRAAHSLKGAARIVDLQGIMELAHAMEDVFSAAGRGECAIDRQGFDLLLEANDRLRSLGMAACDSDSGQPPDPSLQALVNRVRELVHVMAAPSQEPQPKDDLHSRDLHSRDPQPQVEGPGPTASRSGPDEGREASRPGEPDPARTQHLRIDAERLGRLMGLTGELDVASRRLAGMTARFWLCRRRFSSLERAVEALRDSLGTRGRRLPELAAVDQWLDECRRLFLDLLDDFDRHSRGTVDVAGRLRREVLATRLVPFRSIAPSLERLVRGLSRDLGKEVDFQIVGQETLADRDVLDQLDDCLVHMLRNALDHGIELPEERRALGKPLPATLSLVASHRAGMLVVELADDGRGLDLAAIRRRVIERKMVTAEVAENLSDRELVDFLFLPGFSTRGQVDTVSGRGVGLDVVRDTLHALRGAVRVHNQPGQGVRFEITVPLSRSVSRTLVVDIAGEPYAIPVAGVERVLRVDPGVIDTIEGKGYVRDQETGDRIGLVAGGAVLGLDAPLVAGQEIPVVVFCQEDKRYGMAVERLHGIQDLVVQPLDERLGTVPNVSAGSILDSGAPVLILDPDDLVRTMDRLIVQDASRAMSLLAEEEAVSQPAGGPPRILVADDSITVREVEREMLAGRGYQVDVAVDGQEAWHLLKAKRYDLLVTDVDMPRLDGIELVKRIRADRTLHSLPVVIVSYKDRPEDRIRGMDAGADYYLTKGSFEDEKLVQAVRELIGPAHSR